MFTKQLQYYISNLKHVTWELSTGLKLRLTKIRVCWHSEKNIHKLWSVSH